MSAALPGCAPPQASRPPRVRLPEGSCDAHMHVVGEAERYPLDPRRNYNPQVCTLAQYREVMQDCGIARAVLVQPSFYGTDNRLLLETLREAGPAFRGVAVLDPATSDAELAAMHALGVRGLRLNLVNPQMVAVEQLTSLCARVAPLGWHLQVQLLWSDAAQALLGTVAQRVTLPLVIDHMSRPPLPQAPPGLLALLGSGRAWVKLSAPYRMSDDGPGYDSLLPLVHALAAANPDQILWASDWPHTEQAFHTPHDADLVDLLPQWLPDADLRRRACVTNPARLYGF